jgi:hypothetical protein
MRKNTALYSKKPRSIATVDHGLGISEPVPAKVVERERAIRVQVGPCSICQKHLISYHAPERAGVFLVSAGCDAGNAPPVSKVVYGGEWVRTTALSKRFPAAFQACELCRKMSCAPLWYSMKRHVIRCHGCFTPAGFSPSRNG